MKISHFQETDGWTSSDDERDISGLRRRFHSLQKERDKLVSEKRKLKEELGGLDHVRWFPLTLTQRVF